MTDEVRAKTRRGLGRIVAAVRHSLPYPVTPHDPFKAYCATLDPELLGKLHTMMNDPQSRAFIQYDDEAEVLVPRQAKGEWSTRIVFRFPQKSPAAYRVGKPKAMTPRVVDTPYADAIIEWVQKARDLHDRIESATNLIDDVAAACNTKGQIARILPETAHFLGVTQKKQSALPTDWEWSARLATAYDEFKVLFPMGLMLTQGPDGERAKSYPRIWIRR